GLARALEADHQDDLRWAGLAQGCHLAAERVHQLLVDDLYDLLARSEALRDIGAQRPLTNTSEERLHTGDVHVGFEEGQSHLTEGGVDIRLRQAALAAQGRKNALEPLRQ